MSRVDALLGRLTPYRLVSVGLLAVLTAAFVLALTGAVGVDPWALPVGALVATASTWGASVAGARLVGRVAHVESSVVTGLILTLLLWPSTDPAALVTLAGAGAVAGLSKYVLAVRGRHVLNPAAVGAFVAGLVAWPLLGVPGAAWWVATPALLPVVACVGLAIVLRTRQVAPVAAYLVTGLAVVVPGLVAAGATPGAALWTAVGSYPLLFAATVMLTEPATLPPRRAQHVALGTVVALLTVLPLSVGVLRTSPELALLVGNVLAFTLGQRRGVRLAVVGSRALAPTVHEVTFRPSRPLRVAPGQWVELHVPHRADARGVRRTFSVVPGRDGDIVVAYRLPAAPSTFKRALTGLPTGGVVDVAAVGGDLLLPRSRRVPLLLVAAGVGITPFVGMLEQAAAEGRDAVLVLLHGAPDAPPYVDRLTATGVRTLVLGPAPTWALPTGWEHRGDALTGAVVAAAVPDAAGRRAYVSGSPQAVTALVRALRAAGVRRVRRDPFLGYTPPSRRRPDGQAEVTTSATL